MAIISYKCPNCDGELVFDPASAKYKCVYCASLFSQQELEAMKPAEATERENPSAEGTAVGSAGTGSTAGRAQVEDAKLYTCPSCGAEVVTDATTAATFCYYCHNPVVLGGRLDGRFLPNKIIPFAIDKKKAEADFFSYVGRKKFIPKGFFGKENVKKLSGVYFPYWLYGVELEGHMDAEGKKIRTWRSGDEEYRETKVYRITRGGNVELNNLPENALQKANAKLASGVLPYRFEEMKDFHMGYLSGFLAEKRDIESTAVQEKMRSEMRKDAETLLRGSISGYTHVSVNSCNFNARRELWQYVLLPVWTLTYQGRDGNIYYYSMNGQTGEVYGELPIDKGRIWGLAAVVALIVLVIVLMGGYFIW